jgi:hypothetical protein
VLIMPNAFETKDLEAVLIRGQHGWSESQLQELVEAFGQKANQVTYERVRYFGPPIGGDLELGLLVGAATARLASPFPPSQDSSPKTATNMSARRC